MGAARALEIVTEPEQAAVMLQPVRLRLLRELKEPDSASGLARRLNLPRQRLNYHLKALEKAGFVEHVEDRRRGNCVERLVRATATSYLISPDAVGELESDPESVRDRFSATYLIAVAARAIREVATLARRARSARKRLATLTLQTDVSFASPTDRNAFSEELATKLADLAARYHRPDARGARPFRFFVAGHPAVTRNDDREAEERS